MKHTHIHTLRHTSSFSQSAYTNSKPQTTWNNAFSVKPKRKNSLHICAIYNFSFILLHVQPVGLPRRTEWNEGQPVPGGGSLRHVPWWFSPHREQQASRLDLLQLQRRLLPQLHLGKGGHPVSTGQERTSKRVHACITGTFISLYPQDSYLFQEYPPSFTFPSLCSSKHYDTCSRTRVVLSCVGLTPLSVAPTELDLI